jgi:hypothetical protein
MHRFNVIQKIHAVFREEIQLLSSPLPRKGDIQNRHIIPIDRKPHDRLRRPEKIHQRFEFIFRETKIFLAVITPHAHHGNLKSFIVIPPNPRIGEEVFRFDIEDKGVHRH